jgi:hypothetical protein
MPRFSTREQTNPFFRIASIFASLEFFLLNATVTVVQDFEKQSKFSIFLSGQHGSELAREH